MKKKYLKLIFLFTLFSVSNIFSQTTLIIEDFETDDLGSDYQANFFSAGCNPDWFRRTQNDECGDGSSDIFDTGQDALNVQGTYFIGGSDLDEADAGENPLGAGESGYLVLKTLNVSSYNQIIVDIALAGEVGNTVETVDYVQVQYAFDANIAAGANSVDGLPTNLNVNTGTYTTVGAFYGNGTVYQQDADLNGVADPAGSTLSFSFTDYQFVIPNAGGASNLSIRIELKQDNGAEDVAFDNIRVGGNVLSNDNPVLAKGINMYPNPSSGIFNISNDSGISLTSANIYDFSGRSLFEYNLSNKSLQQIDLSNMSAGLYFVTINSKEGKTTKKLILE